MDDATLQQQVAQHGPQLIHWVASVPDVAASHAALTALSIERGATITASRPTPNGLLKWQITVREDGLRLMDGCLPTLIRGARTPLRQPACQWRATHGVAHHVAITAGDVPQLSAQLTTPQGPVTLLSSIPQKSAAWTPASTPSPLLPTLADIEAAAQVVYRDFRPRPSTAGACSASAWAPTAGSSTRTTRP